MAYVVEISKSLSAHESSTYFRLKKSFSHHWFTLDIYIFISMCAKCSKQLCLKKCLSINRVLISPLLFFFLSMMVRVRKLWDINTHVWRSWLIIKRFAVKSPKKLTRFTVTTIKKRNLNDQSVSLVFVYSYIYIFI